MNNENNVPVALTDKPGRTLDMVAAEIRAFTAGMLNNAIEIGRRMVEAKAMLPYGQFGAWISENTGYSASAANNFMRLFDEYGAMQGSLFGASAESQTFGKLPPSKALALLAVPADERETFAEENDAEHTSVRELKRLIAERERERDEARRNAESASEELETVRGDLRDANRVNDRLRRDLEDAQNAPPDSLLLAAMREEERKDAEEKVAAKLAESEQARKDAEEKLSDARRGYEAVKRKLEQAESLKKTITQEAETRINELSGSLEAARAETDEIKTQLSALEQSREQDAKAAKTAFEQEKAKAVALKESELIKAKAELEQANAAAQAAREAESKLRQELAAARKASAESGAASAVDKDIAEFSFLFNQAKDTANKMRTIMLNYRSKTDGAETASRLSGIMVALADAVKEAAK